MQEKFERAAVDLTGGGACVASRGRNYGSKGPNGSGTRGRAELGGNTRSYQVQMVFQVNGTKGAFRT